ncbi:MAG: potassium channel family protein [Henriciella sp.]
MDQMMGMAPVFQADTPSAAYGRLEGWRALDTVYFLTVMSTTVGYGDITPKTPSGRFFTACHFGGITLTAKLGLGCHDFISFHTVSGCPLGNPGRLTATITQIVKFRPAHPAFTFNFNTFDHW